MSATASGHRIPELHDCFLMRCGDLGPELADLYERYHEALDRNALVEDETRAQVVREAIALIDGAIKGYVDGDDEPYLCGKDRGLRQAIFLVEGLAYQVGGTVADVIVADESGCAFPVPE